MKKTDWPVTEDAVRPARLDGTCFYCYEPLGGQHKAECVMRTRTVMVEVIFQIMREVPEHWDEDNIEFGLNESSWCFDNILEDLQPGNGECLCNHAYGKYLREATEEDEKVWLESDKIAELSGD